MGVPSTAHPYGLAYRPSRSLNHTSKTVLPGDRSRCSCPRVSLAPKVTEGDAQGRVLPSPVPTIPLLSPQGSASQMEERRKMVGLVPGMGGRGTHHEWEAAQQKLDETLLPPGSRPLEQL